MLEIFHRRTSRRVFDKIWRRRFLHNTARQVPACPDRIPVTADDVEAYRRDGVVLLRNVFSSAWILYMREAFREGMERPGKYAEFMCSGTTWNSMFEGGRRIEDADMFQDQVFYEDAVRRLPLWAAVATRSNAAEIISKLMGSETAAFFYMHPILKKGGSDRAIPWHQDLPYWKVDGRQIGSVWIPLDDMPLNASVRYLRGSHLWGLFRPRHFVDQSPYEGREELPEMPDIDSMIRDGKTEMLGYEVQAGDALCFDARIVHGSLGNCDLPGKDHRRVALRFGGDDATYCDRSGESAIPTPEIDAAHGLRHGDAIACKAFPKVWP